MPGQLEELLTTDTITLDQVGEPARAKFTELLALWQAASDAREGCLPDITGPDLPQQLRAMGLLGFCHIVDVSDDDPARFFFRLWGSRIGLDRGTDYTNLRIGEYPDLAYSRVIQTDYNTAKMLGLPQIQRVTSTRSWTCRSYTRLVLPDSRDGVKVDRLLIAIAPHEFETL